MREERKPGVPYCATCQMSMALLRTFSIIGELLNEVWVCARCNYKQPVKS